LWSIEEAVVMQQIASMISQALFLHIKEKVSVTEAYHALELEAHAKLCTIVTMMHILDKALVPNQGLWKGAEAKLCAHEGTRRSIVGRKEGRGLNGSSTKA
jgi:hypothetical protein